jgi:hypothetical protein
LGEALFCGPVTATRRRAERWTCWLAEDRQGTPSTSRRHCFLVSALRQCSEGLQGASSRRLGLSARGSSSHIAIPGTNLPAARWRVDRCRRGSFFLQIDPLEAPLALLWTGLGLWPRSSGPSPIAGSVCSLLCPLACACIVCCGCSWLAKARLSFSAPAVLNEVACIVRRGRVNTASRRPSMIDAREYSLHLHCGPR